MKKAIVTLLVGLVIICSLPAANSREFKEHMTKNSHLPALFPEACSSFIIFLDLSGWKVTPGIR
jgi:hypothetical protein